jgi:hypothetical protein
MKDEGGRMKVNQRESRAGLSSFILPPSPLILERETRFELATLALARRCSTTELLPL